ncbi:hypothetical protein DH2020_019601 [Rehmannia glutinosa]|uniref:Uncharacterized protein n=1 Tax=Rehmannia glutinosa TaxID=99300 RepID=A0ABR0WNI3_REHGL
MNCKLVFFFIILANLSVQVLSVVKECGDEDDDAAPTRKALPLKIIAIVSILVTSMIGVCLLVTRSSQRSAPQRSLFVIVKAFAAGIILATGFMHVLPDSFDMLSSSCLKENPWHKFPFTGFVAMLSAIITLMIDSMATSLYSRNTTGTVLPESSGGDREMAVVDEGGHNHFHGHHHGPKLAVEGSQLLRYRVIAMVSIGAWNNSTLDSDRAVLGASNNMLNKKDLLPHSASIKCLKEWALADVILQAEYKFIKKAAMAFFFAVTTPFGIALGMALSSSYKKIAHAH